MIGFPNNETELTGPARDQVQPAWKRLCRNFTSVECARNDVARYWHIGTSTSFTGNDASTFRFDNSITPLFAIRRAIPFASPWLRPASAVHGLPQSRDVSFSNAASAAPCRPPPFTLSFPQDQY